MPGVKPLGRGGHQDLVGPESGKGETVAATGRSNPFLVDLQLATAEPQRYLLTLASMTVYPSLYAR